MREQRPRARAIVDAAVAVIVRGTHHIDVRDAGLGAETTESPLYAGRAVAALAADPDIARHSGKVLHVADLARTYGFTDRDGSQPARYIINNQEGGGDVAQG